MIYIITSYYRDITLSSLVLLYLYYHIIMLHYHSMLLYAMLKHIM